MTTLKRWLAVSTSGEKKDLSRRTCTSLAYIRHIASGYRKASAELAGRIEQSIVEINKGKEDRLPAVSRTDLCPACAVCPYAMECEDGVKDDNGK